MASRAAAAANNNALAPVTMSDDDFTKALQALGMVESADGDFAKRAKVEGTAIYLGDDMYVSNPKTKTPAMRVRLLNVPTEYQGVFIPSELASVLERPDIADRYCKSYFDEPNQGRKYAEDGTSCSSCPIGPFTKKANLPVYYEDGSAKTRKCQWRANLEFQVLDSEGAISDPTVWALDLSTTSVIEFKGTAKEPITGSPSTGSEFNFMQKLARFGAQSNPQNPAQGLRDAMTGLATGSIIADVYQLPAKSDDGSMSWYVTSFTPVDILTDIEQPAAELAPVNEPRDVTPVDDTIPDDLPF